jgi:peptidoglycan/xylan/chitin deacetylase (PgdA/CDA1 family)
MPEQGPGSSRLRPLSFAYHSVASLSRRQDPSYISVDPRRFQRQVAYLRRRGYRFVSASEYGRAVRDGDEMAGLCALTFDDGAEDNATVLPGLLEQLEVPATLFVCQDLLGQPDPFFSPDARIRFMSEAQLRRLLDHPLIEIGSHTGGHADVSELDREQAVELLSVSRRALEELIDRPVTTLAYPWCSFSPAVPGAAQAAGFESAFTCGPRGAWRPYEIPRVIVNTWDRRLTFGPKARGWFDRAWASPPVRFARGAGKRLGLGPPPVNKPDGSGPS